ncbi:MAG TPA: HrcA family transcriptional regulator, partial [Roseiflexaceae bacterium]|nr:HrcA family transcriptional regulator [Roseiflexaceae bacterium]
VVLLVLVLHDGTVRQQSMNLDRVRTQEELSRSAVRINERSHDQPLVRLEEMLAQDRAQAPLFDDLERQVLEIVIGSMAQFEDQLSKALHSDGLMEALNQPEYAEVTRVRQMLEIVQRGKGLGALIPQALASNGVQVVIGGEHGQHEMREYSVVLSRYGVAGSLAGVLGVIGPTRMAYPRTISTVRYISTVMSDLLGEMYSGDAGRQAL